MKTDHEPRHPIGVVSTRTGIPQDVLRAWERRYEAVVPQRTETGRRLYTDEDLRRFRLLKEAVDSGRRISDVAHLTSQDLEALAAEDRTEARAARPPRRSSSGNDAASLLARALEAVEGMDDQALRAALNDASLLLSRAAVRRDVLLPLMREIGDRWRQGSLRVANEHLASSIVRSFLGALGSRHPANAAGPRIVLSTPAGDAHEFGALLAAECAAEIGWTPVYLGPSLPAEEIASAAKQTNARAVALSIVFPSLAPDLQGEITRLRELLGDDVPLVIGGASAGAHREILEGLDAHVLDDMGDFQTLLESLEAA